MTNNQIEIYQLQNGMLTKHTIEILKELKKQNRIIVESLDSQAARGFYIDDKNRKIQINYKE